MIGRIIDENGVKKIVPLTADCGSGNPVGTVIAVYSNKVPNGYLPCNGVTFDTAQFPVLYALLQDNHTPDLRECVLVGAGTSDRTMGAHDEYTVGQFKDDQLQSHVHTTSRRWSETDGAYDSTIVRAGANTGNVKLEEWNTAAANGRTGTTTHGKQVGVNWCIKATSGINENQADNVLSALSPVNTVTSGDMHAVTSNAVAESLSYSTTEVATGAKWIDGKPIYRKVVEEGTVIQVQPQTWADISMLASGISTIISVRAISSGGACWNGFSANATTSSYVQILHTRDTSEGVRYVILEYTKTTD